MTISVDKKTRDTLKKLAANENRNVSQMVRELVRRAWAQNQFSRKPIDAK